MFTHLSPVTHSSVMKWRLNRIGIKR